ncbi:MAG: ATP synthase F1 subunit epsilon [Denitrobacterium sp.]|jgi:F-type H+-transporting ATPase subunit epsilon|nr:ATP synthase F1 subunit epsilon [Denitrobacterium sp.]MCI1480129.1 ATP synthase F1 subunit epsilon [Eggerthellaceae bacterium]
MATLTCDIVTPAKKLFTSECHMVVVPGIEGEMGFLVNHAQLMSTLADGTVRVLSDASTVAHRFALQGGYVQVTGDKVIILADRALPVEDIDLDDVRAKISAAEEEISKADDSADKNLAEVNLAWYRILEHAASAN